MKAFPSTHSGQEARRAERTGQSNTGALNRPKDPPWKMLPHVWALIKPRRAILTNMHSDLDYEALRAKLPPHVEPAYDGMRVRFVG